MAMLRLCFTAFMRSLTLDSKVLSVEMCALCTSFRRVRAALRAVIPFPMLSRSFCERLSALILSWIDLSLPRVARWAAFCSLRMSLRAVVRSSMRLATAAWSTGCLALSVSTCCCRPATLLLAFSTRSATLLSMAFALCAASSLAASTEPLTFSVPAPSSSSSCAFCCLASSASSFCSPPRALPTLPRIMAASRCRSCASCWCTVFIRALRPDTRVPIPRSEAANSPCRRPTCALAVRTVASMAAALPASFSRPACKRSELPASDFVARASSESSVFLSLASLFSAPWWSLPAALSDMVSTEALSALTRLSSTLVTCATASAWFTAASAFSDSSERSSRVSLDPMSWSCCAALNLRCCRASSILLTRLPSAAVDAAS
mmetsp:Transcript_7156/g.18240  ORF Transcript_7156/g.18240 Transcript_7156/m.18240 type:complete len:377 (+) Transcript_7156:273-1403(+)